MISDVEATYASTLQSTCEQEFLINSILQQRSNASTMYRPKQTQETDVCVEMM